MLTWIMQHIRHRVAAGPGAAILMYHRVAEPAVDPWGLAVAPDLFADQLAALVRFRTVMTVGEMVSQHRKGALPRDAVALTFDDGYRDNLTQALPLLDAADVPATLFLTTGWIGTGRAFWWDDLAVMIQSGATAGERALTISGEPFVLDLPLDPEREGFRPTWRAWEPAANAREAAYQALWQRLQRCPIAERTRCLDLLRGVLGSGSLQQDDLPMSTEEARSLVGSSFEIGAHAVSHQPLTTLSSKDRMTEIERSRARCSAIAGSEVTGFAYPHGDLDDATSNMVRDAGFGWACSTREAPVRAADDRFALPRIAVGNINGAALISRITGAR